MDGFWVKWLNLWLNSLIKYTYIRITLSGLGSKKCVVFIIAELQNGFRNFVGPFQRK